MADAPPGPGRLAGRDRELAALRGWLAQARAGHGRLVILTGPPGIGKTRLAEELADGARRGGQQVLWGRAVQEQGAPPLWPWRRILGAVGGAAEGAGLTGDGAADGARSDDLAAARFRAAAAAADALTAAAGAGGLLVVLEDMQWADHASLFLLRELAAELPGSRLLVLATCRDAAGDSWRSALGDLARMAGGSAEVSHIVSSLLRDLDDGARTLLAAASVLGAEFSPALAAEVAEAGEVGPGVTGALSAAAALEAAARQAPERGGEVSAHLLRAAPDRAALRRAADWAAAAAAPAAERAELLVALATAEYRGGQLAASLQHAVTAADTADRAPATPPPSSRPSGPGSRRCPRHRGTRSDGAWPPGPSSSPPWPASPWPRCSPAPGGSTPPTSS